MDCFCLLSKLNHLACNKVTKSHVHYRETGILLHAKWSNLQNTQENSTKFSGMLGEDEKMIQQKIC